MQNRHLNLDLFVARSICCAFVLAFFAVLCPFSLVAQTSSVLIAEPATINPDDSMNQLITGLVLKHMPHSYSRDKDWGRQDERWDGIKWSRDGWQIKTKRRKKMVNHGTWKKYAAELMDPQNKFSVIVRNIRQNAEERMAFDIEFATKLRLSGRQAKWVKGVQAYSISAEGQATVRLKLSIVMDIDLDPTKLPPDMVFRPRATAADLTVVEFRIDRVSKLGGEFAQQATRAARGFLDEEITNKEKELVEKINREFEKNADEMRLSLSDAVSSKWSKRAAPFLPPAIKSAVKAGTKN